MVYTQKEIIDAFKVLNVTTKFEIDFFDIISNLKFDEQCFKINKANILRLPNGESVMDCLCYHIESDKGYHKDYFISEDLSEETAKYTDYIKVDDKIYEVLICGETVWCDDFRAYCVSLVHLETFKEITNFEIISEDVNNFKFKKK